MKVKLTRSLYRDDKDSRHAPGEFVDLPDDEARWLVEEAAGAEYLAVEGKPISPVTPVKE